MAVPYTLGQERFELRPVMRVPKPMRTIQGRIARTGRAVLVVVPLLLAFNTFAQNAQRFQRALASGNERALDRWMEHEIHRVRKGHPVSTPSGSYTAYHNTHDSLVAFLRRQPGVEDAAWDKCIGKLDIWPGHSTIGLRWRVGEELHERCWTVQEGIPGTVNFFGWRPKVRKARQHLKYKRASTCPGFVEQQRNYCAERGR
jgi:hypothetical protein